MDEKILYRTPIINSWGAVTLVNHCGLITPEKRWCVISLDKDSRPIYPEDVTPGNLKSFIVVTRRTGDPTPTKEEVMFCEAWRKAAEDAGSTLVDYIIMCGAHHYSFADEQVHGPGKIGF